MIRFSYRTKCWRTEGRTDRHNLVYHITSQIPQAYDNQFWHVYALNVWRCRCENILRKKMRTCIHVFVSSLFPIRWFVVYYQFKAWDIRDIWSIKYHRRISTMIEVLGGILHFCILCFFRPLFSILIFSIPLLSILLLFFLSYFFFYLFFRSIFR